MSVSGIITLWADVFHNTYLINPRPSHPHDCPLFCSALSDASTIRPIQLQARKTILL
jgi:hypothetical protein